MEGLEFVQELIDGADKVFEESTFSSEDDPVPTDYSVNAWSAAGDGARSVMGSETVHVLVVAAFGQTMGVLVGDTPDACLERALVSIDVMDGVNIRKMTDAAIKAREAMWGWEDARSAASEQGAVG